MVLNEMRLCEFERNGEARRLKFKARPHEVFLRHPEDLT